MERSLGVTGRLPTRPLVAVCTLSALIFCLDLLTPVGVATGVAYVTIAAAAAGARDQRWVVRAAILATILTSLGFVLSPGDHSNIYGWANRGLAVLLIWLVALLLTLRLRADRRFGIAVEASRSGMILTDRRGTILFANGEAHTMFGHSPGRLAGQNVDLLVPDRVRVGHADLRAGYLRGPAPRQLGVGREVHGRRANGDEFPVEIGLTPVPTEKGLLVLVAVVDISSRRDAAVQNARLAAIVRTSHDAITAVDLAGTITAWNEGAERTYGWSEAEMLGQPLQRIVPEARLPELEGIFAQVRDGESVDAFVTQQITKDRGTVTVSVSVAPIRGPTGRVVGASAIARDISAQQSAEALLLETTMALANAMPGISRVDAEDRLAHVNADFAGLFARSPVELVGTRWLDILDPDDRGRAEAALQEMLRQGKAEFQASRPAGAETRFIDLLLVRRLDAQGRFVGHHCFARDVTDRRRSEIRHRVLAAQLEEANSRLQELADVDPLTTLMNRRALERALANELERSIRQGSPLVAILIDLDDFKAINERFGHATGDSVLVESARRIEAAARSYDHVARIGGDEFLVLLPDTRTAEGLLVGERIRLAVAREPVDLGTTALHLSASCGVEEVAAGCASIAAILARCRDALRRAKRTGKDRVETSTGHTARRPRVSVLFDGGQLRAVHQPIYDLKDRVVVGYELLSRGPRGPLEFPIDFLHASQQQGVLPDVDLLCLQNCLRAIPFLPPGHRVHVNMFPMTLVQAPIERILDTLAEAPPGSRLCLELNEHELVGDPLVLRHQLERIRERGIQLALDDVGFGRSSLESLVILEPDLVKIDHRYVRGLADDAGRRRALDRLMNVVNALRTQAIGEGIEQEADLDALLALGLRYGQGFLLGAPAEMATARGGVAEN